jgi:hypothetical protein
MTTNQGLILHLFVKEKYGLAMREAEELNLKVGHGIERDINAKPISPRQILVVRYEDIVNFAIPPGELRKNIVIVGIKHENFTLGSLITFDSGAAIRSTFNFLWRTMQARSSFSRFIKKYSFSKRYLF